jgi:hypothetical protein
MVPVCKPPLTVRDCVRSPITVILTVQEHIQVTAAGLSLNSLQLGAPSDQFMFYLV